MERGRGMVWGMAVRAAARTKGKLYSFGSIDCTEDTLAQAFRGQSYLIVEGYSTEARQTHGCTRLLTFDTCGLFSLAWKFLSMAR